MKQRSVFTEMGWGCWKQHCHSILHGIWPTRCKKFEALHR